MNRNGRLVFWARADSMAVVALLSVSAWVRAAELSAVQPFTFIQISDVHAPQPQSQGTLARLRTLGEIRLEPFGLNVPKPSFAIATGDLTEFGGGNGWWTTYLSYWKDCGMPVYSILGNHDNTWHANIKLLRDGGLGPCYSFDARGCHFVALMTATPQDPRPSVPEEQILWLKADLAKVGTATPVFVYFHHPLGGQEFASRYDWERLLDVLRGYNTVLLLAGHSHGYVYRPVGGIDQVTGGSTFGPNAGFAVLSVQEGKLRAAYWKADRPSPDVKLLEKSLPPRAPYPKVEILRPRFRDSTDGSLTVSARFADGGRTARIEKATFSVDDELKGDLLLSGQGSAWTASGAVDLGGLLPGAHYVRVDFEAAGEHYPSSTEFFLEPTNHPTAWRAYLAASSKVTPAVADGTVYVGANDGKFQAFDAASGKEKWSVDTGAEILAEPLVLEDRICTANGLGLVAAYSSRGQRLWSFTAGDAVYSSPVRAGDKIVFGCNDGRLYALEADTGKQVWTNADAAYAIESKPFVAAGKVYYGAWDENIRCVSASEGKLIWRRVSEGVRAASAARRYYSPADAMPVVVGDKLMIADRNYRLTILNADTGEPVSAMSHVAATGLSEDGAFVYLRRTDGRLTKVDATGKELWSVAAGLGSLPTEPRERSGVVYVASATGTVSAVAARDGKILWRYQASPRLFVMSSVVCDGPRVYVTAFDGSLTAIRRTPLLAANQNAQGGLLICAPLASVFTP